MSETDDEAQARRAQSILTQALKQAGIRGSDEPTPAESLLSRKNVYWERVGDEIELRLSYVSWSGDKIQTTFGLKATVLYATRLFRDDVDAVNALVAVLAYLQHVISTTLPRIHHELMVRNLNSLLDSWDEGKEGLARIQEVIVKPMDSSFEAQDKKSRDEIRGRRKRGGNTRTSPAWRYENTRKVYASRVNDRKLLATCIKEMFDKCDGEAGWVEELRQDKTFQLLSTAVPDELITWAVKRVASENIPAREREPLSIACEIARRELGLPEQSIQTLRDYYSKGEALLRRERKQQTQ